MYSYKHKCSNKILTSFHQRSYLRFFIPYIYKVVQHANYIFENFAWPLFSSSIKKENVINECIAKMLMKCLLLWTNVLMTHVIAFQILNKTHMCYYMAMNKLSKNQYAKFLDLWLHTQSQNVTELTTQLYNPIKALLPWHLQLLLVTIECQFYVIFLLIWLILISLFTLKLNCN